MRILYDPQVFSTHKFGGVSRYFVESISNISDMGHDVCLPIWKTNNAYFHENARLKADLIKKKQYKELGLSMYDRLHFKGKITVTNFLKQAGLCYSNEKKCVPYLKQQNYDIVHPTFYDPYFTRYIGNKPFVLTIYDMIHERFKESIKNPVLIAQKKILAEKASAVIAISEATKSDIVNILKISPDKIHVVYLANSMVNALVSDTNTYLPDRYILFIGQRWHYKNFNRFIRACSSLAKELDFKIICTASSFTDEEHVLFRELAISDRMVHINADDALLAKLYTNALLFVFPSLCEGFGLPVLEAFACHCPAAISNVSSLPEIGGDAAEYLDPYNEDSIRETIKMLLLNEGRRKELIARGIQRSTMFSWRKTATMTVGVYQQVCEKY
jgi:glycosyltransferase involved in cell wall biosynthesis